MRVGLPGTAVSLAAMATCRLFTGDTVTPRLDDRSGDDAVTNSLNIHHCADIKVRDQKGKGLMMRQSKTGRTRLGG